MKIFSKLMLSILLTTWLSPIVANEDESKVTRHQHVNQNQLTSTTNQLQSQITSGGSNNATVGNFTLGSLVNSSTIGNLTLGSLTNNAAYGNATLGTLVNSTTIGNLTLGSLTNSGTMGNAALAAFVNSSTIGNTTLGSLVNSSTIGNLTLGSLTNSSTIGNLTLGSLVNSSTIGNLTLGSLTNSSTIGNLTLGSLVNSSTIGNLTLGSLIAGMQSFLQATGGDVTGVAVATAISWTQVTQTGAIVTGLPGSTLTLPTAGTYMITVQGVWGGTAGTETLSFTNTGTSSTVFTSPIFATALIVPAASKNYSFSFSQIFTATAGMTIILNAVPSATSGTVSSLKMNIVRIS